MEKSVRQEDGWEKALNYYDDRFDTYGEDVASLDTSEKSQYKRFAVLLEGIKTKSPKDSFLDVGCGFGDFSSLIYWSDNYHGIDLSSNIIETAKKKYPRRKFSCQNIIELKEKYDWVIAVAPFNVKVDDNKKFIQDVIKKMWDLSKKGVILDVLIKGSNVKENPEMYYYDPGEILNFCRTLTENVVCRVDYMPHDAAFYLYKDKKN